MQREIVKWLQSLDLSSAIHNPRRDIANGFLVAEIVSRYDKDVSLHSYDTGSGMAKRLDNWAQLQRAMTKRHQANVITNEHVASVTQGREGAAVDMLEKLYVALVRRPLKMTHAMAGPDVTAVVADPTVPAYAKPTASNVLRLKNDDSRDRFIALTGEQDQDKIHLGNESLLEQHRLALQMQRMQDPQRFVPKPRPPSGSKQKAAQQRGGASSLVQRLQAARQLAVKSVDDDILSAFAARHEAEKEARFRAQFDPDEDLGNALSRVIQRPLRQIGYAGGGTSPAMGGGAGGSTAAGNNAAAASTGAPIHTWDAFVAARHTIADDAKALVWRSVLDLVNNIARHIANRRSEAYHLVMTLSFAWMGGASNSASSSVFPVGDRDQPSSNINDQMMSGSSLTESPRDVWYATRIIAETGAALATVNADAAFDVVTTVLVPSVSECFFSRSNRVTVGDAHRLVGALVPYCNQRDVEAVKGLIAALLAPPQSVLTASGVAGQASVASSAAKVGGGQSQNIAAAVTATHAMVTTAVLTSLDLGACLGLDDVAEYYAMRYLSHAHPTVRCFGVQLLDHMASPATAFRQKQRREQQGPPGHTGGVSPVPAADGDTSGSQLTTATPRPSSADGAGGRSLESLAAPPAAAQRMLVFAANLNSLCGDTSVEVRLCLLQLYGRLLLGTSLAGGGNSPDGSPGSFGSLDDTSDGKAGGPAPAAGGAAASSPPPIPRDALEDGVLQLLASFDSQPLLIRRVALCTLAPFVMYDNSERVCVALVTAVCAIDPDERHQLLAEEEGEHRPLLGGVDPSSAVVQSQRSAASSTSRHVWHGRSNAFDASGLTLKWHPISMGLALLAVQPSVSCYTLLSVLQPLLAATDLSIEREAWLDIAVTVRPDVIEAITNTANARGVTQDEMAPSAAMAGQVVQRLYTDLSGEWQGGSVVGGGGPSSSSSNAQLQSMAIDWLTNL